MTAPVLSSPSQLIHLDPQGASTQASTHDGRDQNSAWITRWGLVRRMALVLTATEASVMEALSARTSSQPDCGHEAEAYWKACAEIREGKIAAGVADLLPLTWAKSPVLRERVRLILTKDGAAIQ
jgi:hypothetical protein